jgi:hypothetical protein
MSKARDIASAPIAPSTVSATELGYVDGVTSAIQTQLDAKTAKSTLTTTGDIYYASSANTPARLGIGSSAQVLTVASGIPSWAAPAGGSLQEQRFTTSGTFTVPTGVTKVWATVVGAGGGGGNRQGQSAIAFGGFAGAYITEQVTVTPGESITVTVGTGVTSGTGGNSSFGSLTASGGGAGAVANIPDYQFLLGGQTGYGVSGGIGAGGAGGNSGSAGGAGIVIVRWLG